MAQAMARVKKHSENTGAPRNTARPQATRPVLGAVTGWGRTSSDAGVADLGPEFLVADRIGRVKTDMAEAGDAGVAAREVAPSAAFWPHHKLDVVTGRIAEADEGFHLALFGLLRGTGVHRMAKRFQR